MARPVRSSSRHALTLMVGTLGSRVSGLLREVLLVALFVPQDSDVFKIAWTVPNLFRELLAEGALTNAFVPIYKELPPSEQKRFSGAVASVLFLVNALLLLLIVVSAPWIVDLLLAEQSNVNRELAIRTTRVVFPLLMTISFSALAMGILNSEERFLAPAWAPAALNVVMIAAMFVFPKTAVWLAVGAVLGGLAQFGIQLPALAKAGLLPRPSLWHPSLPLVLTLTTPFLFTTGARQFLSVVAQNIVSNELLFAAGAVTAYSIAAMLFGLVLGLFSISPATAYYSRLAADAVGGGSVRETLGQGLRFISFLCIPAGLLLWVFSDAVVAVLFQLLPNAPGQENTLRLAVLATAPLGLAVFPVGLNNFLVRPFFVRKRVRIPIIISVSFTLLNALFFTVLTPRLGIAGLSYSTALTGWLQFMVLLVFMRRDEGLELRGFLLYSLKLFAAALFALMPAVFLSRYVGGLVEGWWGGVLELSTGGLITLTLYGLIAAWLGVPELAALRRRFKRG